MTAVAILQVIDTPCHYTAHAASSFTASHGIFSHNKNAGNVAIAPAGYLKKG